jgi:2-C-methyl-D-erythritol 4-phosphate cytidylyltransferase / 2-C-methyl-D-erythritol 2,4-cyclodiphosphate synthase
VKAQEPRAAAIVLAAGAGRRIGAERPKAFLPIGDRPMLAVAAAAAAASPAIEAIVVTAPAGYEVEARACVEGFIVPAQIVTGGESRQASVRAALAVLGSDVRIVAVHDAARPFAPPELFTEVVRAVAEGADGAIPLVSITDTVKRVVGARVVGTLPREDLGLAQTPQAFLLGTLRTAHDRAMAEGDRVTDDAALLERAGTVVAIAGDPMNFKITTMMDLARAEARMGGLRA